MENVKKNNRHKNVPQQKKGKGKKNENEGKFAGFTTLNQVTGVPKAHSFHSRIPLQNVKTVREPGTACAICGEKIDSIAQAVTSPSGAYVHFDCALEDIRKNYHVHEGQSVSYVGKGAFGICEKDEEGKWHILERIQYESPEANTRFKEYVEEQKVE